MTVARKLDVPQPRLFTVEDNEPITIAACRNYAGEFFELATIQLLGGYRLLIDATKDYCPDIQVAKNSYLEVKSIGRNGAAMCYEARLAKDSDLIAQNGSTLRYILWNHNYKCGANETLGSLRRGLAESVKAVYLVDFDIFKEVMEAAPVMTLNKANGEARSRPQGQRRGYGSHGYTTGHRVTLAKFRERISSSTSIHAKVVVNETYELRPFDMHVVTKVTE